MVRTCGPLAPGRPVTASARARQWRCPGRAAGTRLGVSCHRPDRGVERIAAAAGWMVAGGRRVACVDTVTGVEVHAEGHPHPWDEQRRDR